MLRNLNLDGNIAPIIDYWRRIFIRDPTILNVFAIQIFAKTRENAVTS